MSTTPLPKGHPSKIISTIAPLMLSISGLLCSLCGFIVTPLCLTSAAFVSTAYHVHSVQPTQCSILWILINIMLLGGAIFGWIIEILPQYQSAGSTHMISIFGPIVLLLSCILCLCRCISRSASVWEALLYLILSIFVSMTALLSENTFSVYHQFIFVILMAILFLSHLIVTICMARRRIISSVTIPPMTMTSRGVQIYSDSHNRSTKYNEHHQEQDQDQDQDQNRQEYHSRKGHVTNKGNTNKTIIRPERSDLELSHLQSSPNHIKPIPLTRDKQFKDGDNGSKYSKDRRHLRKRTELLV